MRLRRRYRTRGLLWLTTGVSFLLAGCHYFGGFVWVMQAALLSQRFFGQDHTAALVPAGVALGAGILGALFWRGRRFESVLAALAITLSLLSPRFLAWYTWNVVGDHTANIGVGILMLAQPILAPVAGFTGWLIGWALKSAIFEFDPADSPSTAGEQRSRGQLRSWQDPESPRD